MSKKRIIILYNAEETKMDIDLEEINTCDLLINKIKLQMNDCNPSFHYNLMAINTSVPYTLVEADNYMAIMNEKIAEGDLKLFFNKIDMKELDIENNDDDFIIEDEDENENKKKEKQKKEENPKIEKIEVNQLKINDEINKKNENDNIIINNKEEDDKLFSQTNMLLNRIEEVMGGSTFSFERSKTMAPSSNRIKDNKNKNNNINNNASNYLYNDINDINDNNDYCLLKEDTNKKNDKKFKTKNNNLIIDDEGEDELTNNLINPDTFKDKKCSICNDALKGIEYICCVCENIILCTKCEKEHYHPCIKCKSPFLSNPVHMYNFITNSYGYKIPANNFFFKLFKKEYEISIIPLTDKKICLRPNKEYLLPIKIINYTREVVKSSQFDVVPKDNKLVQIYSNDKFVMGPNSNKTLKMKCITGSNLGKEKINFYGFSEELCFKNQNLVNFSLEFEINEDEEEENINGKLGYNENVIMYTKQHKQLALEILESIGDKNMSKKHINKVFNVLIENEWNKNKSINNIKALKK